MELMHGGDLQGAAERSGKKAEELLDFSANINPLGVPPAVREAIVRELHSVIHYPDPLSRKLRAAISEAEGVPAEQILCGNGGADLIYRLVCASRPKTALVMVPTFAEYEEALNQVGSELRFYSMQEDLCIREDILNRITGDLELLFLCNPNNPTGILTGRPLLLSVLEKADSTGTTVLLDECFLDFVEEQEEYTLKEYLNCFQNLVILKSFTKLYAIPGLRLGYCLSSNRKLLNRMEKAGQPWAVGTLASAAGMAALQEADFRERTVSYVNRERAKLKAGLEALGLQVYNGRANYLCFRVRGEEHLAEKLLEQGILIRRCSNYRGLSEEYYRAAVRTGEENERLLAALRTVGSEAGWKKRQR